MENKKISKFVLKRLPGYLSYLKSLPVDAPARISATTLANALGMGQVQVRKDLATISDTGRRRTGRSREQLIRDIENFLDYEHVTNAVLVGAGKLGQALLDYSGFEENGLNVMAAFDTQPSAKQSASGKAIYPMSRLESFCKCYDVRIGIIAVPDYQAQAVCDSLVACGIRAIWNFAPVHLKTPDYVLVQNENLAASLTSLRLQLKESLKTQ